MMLLSARASMAKRDLLECDSLAGHASNIGITIFLGVPA
jgi:hypothetical protein